MGGFTAEFRGFWAGCGCGAAIQRTADTAGAVGRKIFKKGVQNLKIGVREGSEGGAGALYIGCAR